MKVAVVLLQHDMFETTEVPIHVTYELQDKITQRNERVHRKGPAAVTTSTFSFCDATNMHYESPLPVPTSGTYSFATMAILLILSLLIGTMVLPHFSHRHRDDCNSSVLINILLNTFHS